MPITTYQLTDADAGRIVGPKNGILVNLSMTKPPVNEQPWGDSGGLWKAGYFAIKGEHDIRDLYCIDPMNNGSAFSWQPDQGEPGPRLVARAIVDGSYSYRGQMRIRSVPTGSLWSMTLSDVPVPVQRHVPVRPDPPPPPPPAAAISAWAGRTAAVATMMLQAMVVLLFAARR